MADESQSVMKAEISTIEALLLRNSSELSDININDVLDMTLELKEHMLRQPEHDTD